VRPTGVDLHLDVDPEGSDRFVGHVGMDLELDRGSRTVTLHAAGLGGFRARARVGTGAWTPAEVEVDPLREVIRLRFPRALAKGRARLEIDYEGGVRDDLEGLYRVDCSGRRFLFSQLCTTRARALLPCFDEPGFKTRYAITVTTAAATDVISNMPVEREAVHPDGRKTIDFVRTPALSTYLLAVAVGELERSAAVYSGETEIRVIATPGKSALMTLALEVARRALPVLEAWFGLPYPYPKLDLVAVPDFSFGAMENAGAVFFRETLLLADEAELSFAERKRLTETICHELAHMWFGNLVTMAWWDDLWLNESFATWMAFHVVGEIEPEWHTWQTFQHRKDAALDLDALVHTHPVYVPVASAEEANENFDLITYEKGASVIRMLAGFLGPETFQEGVRRYVAAHADGNACAADLWAALEAVSDQPVAHIMRAWIEQSGHPRLTIERGRHEGEEVFVLEQARHQTVPPQPRANGNDEDMRWPVPFIGHVGGAREDSGREIRLIVEERQATIPAVGIEWIHGNAGEAGFYRPVHGEPEREALLENINRLLPVERQGLVGHEWALVQAGVSPISALLRLVETLRDERDPDVLEAVALPLTALSRGLVHDLGADTPQALRGWVEGVFGASLDAIGIERPEAESQGEGEGDRRLRSELLGLVGLVAERPSLVAAARDQAARILDGGTAIDPELTARWLLLGARHGDDALYDRCLDALALSATPQGRQRALFALTEFNRADLASRTLERCAAGKVSSQDLVFVLGRCLAHPGVQNEAWAFIQARWDALARHLPPMHAPRLIAATTALRSAAHRREVIRFFRDLDLPSTKRALEQARERFEAHARLAAHAGAELEAWLQL